MDLIRCLILLALGAFAFGLPPLRAQIQVGFVDYPAVIAAMPETNRAKLGLQAYYRFQAFELEMEIRRLMQPPNSSPKSKDRRSPNPQPQQWPDTWSMRMRMQQSVDEMKLDMVLFLQTRANEAIREVAKRQQVGLILLANGSKGRNWQSYDPFIDRFPLPDGGAILDLDPSLGTRVSIVDTDLIYVGDGAFDLTGEVIAWLSRREE